MKKILAIKKQFLILMLALLTIQQTQTSDSNMNRFYTISATAIVAALAYAAHLHINEPTSPTIPDATTSSIQSIIFDIDGVLSTTNKLQSFYEVGIPVTLWEITDQMQLPSEKILFDSLAGVPAISTYKSYNKGLLMPQIMIDWQTGAQSLSTIRTSIYNYLATAHQPESVKNWALQTAMMMTDPARLVNTRQAIQANVTLLHELKDKGYKLYILSNWDATSFPLFKAAFPEIFMHHGKETFDDIIISGDIGIVKPESSIFEKCLKKFHLTAQNSLFIDDEPANIAAANQLNIQTILCDPNNSQTLRDHIIEHLTR